ncbi:MAG: hypothetical protein CEE43_13440 [Promethearchaeota archaeon Loki_b32]|nr:MAG: hypothetical protein CEE43_13440 [Candidatus Lokiarchaeota archaeon Loki_b32]
MTLYLSLIKTYIIFILFSVIISIFGSVFIYIYQKHSKKKWNLTLLEYGIISYAVGILIYIFISYILNLFEIFNFYTAYLPFLIISSTFLLFILKKKKIRNTLTQIKRYLSSNYKSIFIHILILFIIYLFQFITFWIKTSESSALLARDTYYWTKHVLYLNENGIVNYSEHGSTYPWGFFLFCSGNILISNSFTTTYFFMKFACFPFLNFYILVMFSISKRVFKKNAIIFFCLFSILAQIFFIYRTMMFLSSSIALLLILISFLILLTETPNYLLCFIISATFLINPVYSLYFVIILAFYYIIKIKISNRNRILIIKESLLIMLLSIFFVVPYILSVSFFYSKDLIDLFRTFSGLFEIQNYNQLDTLVNAPLNSRPNKFLLSLSNFIFYDIQFILYFGFIILGPGLGLFYKKRKLEGNSRKIINFLKVGYVIMILVLLSPFFLFSISFFRVYFIRILEVSVPFLILLLGLTFEWGLSVFGRVWEKIKLNHINLKKKVEKTEFNKRVLSLPFFLIIFMFTSNLLAYNYTSINIRSRYYYDDSLVECVFFINRNIEPESNIAVYEIYSLSQHAGAIYYLLYKYNLEYYQFIGNTSFNDFWDFLQMNSINNLIINLSSFDQDFIDDFSSNSTFNILVGESTSSDFTLYEIL